jgi:hypothetical protein
MAAMVGGMITTPLLSNVHDPGDLPADAAPRVAQQFGQWRCGAAMKCVHSARKSVSRCCCRHGDNIVALRMRNDPRPVRRSGVPIEVPRYVAAVATCHPCNATVGLPVDRHFLQCL